MNTGEMDEWNAALAREKLTGVAWPRFDPLGLFFVTCGPAGTPDGTPVGPACAGLKDPGETEMGNVHMVCVLPEHRGHKLGQPLCLAVLHRFRDRGVRRAMLNTNDWRLGAIKTYLELGFQPYTTRPDQPDAWDAVVRALGWDAPLQPLVEETT